jgi:hypothetical protein
MLITATSAFAATVAVGTCQPGKISFDALDDAVNGVPDGSTILVCPGIYQEQIKITKNLTLKGVSNGNSSLVAIVPPPGGPSGNAFSLFEPVSFFGGGTPFAAQVFVTSGANVTISGITIDGQGPITANCYPMIIGVLVQDASLTLTSSVVKNQLQTGPGPGPCFFIGANGVGVFAQNDSLTATTVNITNSAFSNSGMSYESDGASNTSTLTTNTFIGSPASDGNALSLFNGFVTVKGNSFTSFTFSPIPNNNFNLAAYAMLLECNQGGSVINNTISNSQGGVVFAFPNCPTTGVYVQNNIISDASFIGIQVAETNGTITGNTINNTQTAIRLPNGSDGNTITGNKINGTCAAFGSSPLSGTNLISPNTITSALNLQITNNTGLCP